MPQSAGSRLGPYEIVAPLGSGGMGAVYRAHDPRMGRDVAIKVVAEQFSDRLSREVHAVAALNHPSICTIHDVGPDYIVMELIEGPTLAEHIAREGATRALDIALQIAEALEAAHAKGIVHRDLKPANVMLKDGVTVKVLDFGLAKAGGAEAPGDDNRQDTANSPTMMSPAVTQAGVILGTAAYMAPEQARGKPIDKRADIWAFGCVLYEMLTGRRPFGGDEVSDTLAFIITKDPDWAALPVDTPAPIRRLLTRCLRKDPKDRLHDIADARIEIKDALASPDVEMRTPAAARSPMWRQALPWSVAALAVIAAGVTIGTRPRSVQTPAAQVTHFTIPLPDGTVPTEGGIAVSADGAQIALSGGPARQIFVRAIDQVEAKPIAGTEGAVLLAFSPDGRWVSYLDGASPNRLRKVPVAGGASQILAQADSRRAPPVHSWATDDTILFAHGGGLSRIPSGGGTPQVLETVDSKSRSRIYFDARLLPGGRELLALTEVGAVAVDVQTLATRTVVGRVEGWPRFAPTNGASALGHLVSYDPATSSVLATPFDSSTLQVTGPSTRVLDGVQAAVGPFGWFGFSDSGTLAYVEGGAGVVQESRMVWVDRTGAEQTLAAPARRYDEIRLSPDATRIAAEIVEGSPMRPEHDVWIYDLGRGTLTRMTFDHGSSGPAWTPDAKHVAYLSVSLNQQERRRDLELRSAPVDGTRSTTLIKLEDNDVLRPSSISPDGKVLIGSAARSGGTNSVDAIRVARLGDGAAGGARPKPLTDSPFGQREAQFSPDGRFVAYQSNESGRDEIHVVSYPQLDGKWQVSVDGGTAPRWAANGKELFYRHGDRMMAVDVQTRPTFRPGAARVLFEGRYRPSAYDVSADGARFLMLKAVAGQESQKQIRVVVNWFEELRRKAPLPK